MVEEINFFFLCFLKFGLHGAGCLLPVSSEMVKNPFPVLISGDWSV